MSKHPISVLKRELRDAYVRGYILHMDFHETAELELVSLVFPKEVRADTFAALCAYVEATFAANVVKCSFEYRTMQLALTKAQA